MCTNSTEKYCKISTIDKKNAKIQEKKEKE